MSEVDGFAQFKTVFFTECDELTSDMEQLLSDLQSGDADDETLNAIFRAVHSIKAGAGTFQYTELIKFSHIFETLLDKLRNGEVSLTDEVTQVLFRASDVLSDLIAAAQNEEDLGEDYGAEAKIELESFLDLPHEEPVADVKDEEEVGASDGDAIKNYAISFSPNAEVFRHANEPILLIRELSTLGELDVDVDVSQLPAIHDIEHEDSYLSWKFKLSSSENIEEIEEVFEFVVDDCKLEIELLEASADDQEDEVSVSKGDAETKQEELELKEVKKPSDKVASNNKTASAAKAPVKTTSIRVDLQRIDKLVNMVGELVITQAMLTQDIEDIDTSKNLKLVSGMEELASHARELQDNVMAIRMQAVKSVFSRMPRLVRDLSGQLKKKVKLVTVGEATEVDKTVIEEIADPLTHMIRNSLDHGIEMPDVREKNGKDAVGTIRLSAEHRGGRIVIEISDDGAGINREVVLKKALEKNLIESDDISDEEIDNLIFHPGFSTAEQVTNVSGRGVGMDVVRKNILSLGGRISVQSETGKGSKFTLSLPLTLAVLDGMIIGIGAEKYVIPVNSIVESIRPDKSEVMTLFGNTKVVRIRGEYIPLIPAGELLGVSNALTDPSEALVVIVETDGGNHAGVIVDKLLGQQQVVIKSLETNYQHIEGVSAATILGNGQVCLIVDLDGLEEMDRARRGGKKLTKSAIDNAMTVEQNTRRAG